MAIIPVEAEQQLGTEANESKNTHEGVPEAEAKLVKSVHKLFSEAKEDKKSFDHAWLDNWKFYRGNQWKNKRPSYRNSLVLNLAWSHVQSVFSLLTDPRPNIETIPAEPQDFEFSQILSKVLRSKWRRDHYQNTLAECVLESCIFGTGIGHVPWVKQKLDGQGDWDFKSEDPFYCFPDPECKGFLNKPEESGYFIVAKPTSVRKARKDFPDKAKLIKADLGSLEDLKFDALDSTEFKITSPIDRNLVVSQDDDFGDDGMPLGGKGKTLLITAYIRSDEMEQIEKEVRKEDGTVEMRKFEQKRFPNGRKITISNNRVLEDVPFDDENGLIPYARLVDHIVPRSFWGEGEIDQIKSPQMLINKIFSYAVDVLSLMGNPVWIVDTEAQVDTDNLVSSPGGVIEKKAGTEVRREAGVQLQPFVLQLLDRAQQNFFNDIRGLSEVSQGQVSPQANSGLAINLLQEASQIKIRSKARNMDVFLQEIGSLMVSRTMQYYTVPRVVRITGDGQGPPKYFKFNVNKNVDSGQVESATVQEFNFQPGEGATTGHFVPSAPKTMPLSSKHFDVLISTGTSLPFAKAQKANVGERLFDKGVLDAEDLLGAVEWPEKEKVLEKFNQRQAAAAQAAAAEQQAAAGGLPPQGPPPPGV